MQNTVSDVEG